MILSSCPLKLDTNASCSVDKEILGGVMVSPGSSGSPSPFVFSAISSVLYIKINLSFVVTSGISAICDNVFVPSRSLKIELLPDPTTSWYTTLLPYLGEAKKNGPTPLERRTNFSFSPISVASAFITL